MNGGFDVCRISKRVDEEKLIFNFEQIKTKLPNDVKVICVVKANAYGIGAVRVSKIYEKIGVDFFAVATIAEAIELRESGIKAKILILGYTPPSRVYDLHKFDISQTVFSPEYAKALSNAAKLEKVKIDVHLKIDTGMSRIGFFFQDKDRDMSTLEEIKAVGSIEEFNVVGIFTHFLGSDEITEKFRNITNNQIDNFKCIVNLSREFLKDLKFIHCSNSGAILCYPTDFCNYVRAGTILYGYYPSDSMKNRILLKEVLEIKTKIIQLKTVPANSLISYGATFKTSKETLIATVPIGYADGLCRALSNIGKMIVNDHYAPIIGRVCMDQCMLDVTDVPYVMNGNAVTILGKEKNCKIGACDLAKILGTAPSEITCGFSKLREN